MNREDPYRQKTESTRRRVGRTTIQEPVKAESLPPRSELHRERRAKKKKKINFPWIRLQVTFFILLPIIIFVIYTNRDAIFPETKTTVKEENGGYETIQIDNENKKAEAKDKNPKASAKNNDSESKPITDSNSSEQSVENPTDSIQTNENTNDTVPDQVVSSDSGQAVTTPPTDTTVNQPVENTFVEHTVKTGETLYRISVNYYGSANAKSGIQKIKQANHLPNESIRVGQKLKIPK